MEGKTVWHADNNRGTIRYRALFLLVFGFFHTITPAMVWSLSSQNNDARFRAHIFQKRRIYHFSVCGQLGGISEPYPTVVANHDTDMRNVQTVKRRVDADIIPGF